MEGEARPAATPSGVIEVRAGVQLLAIILRASYGEAGIHFLTDNELSQQLAFMRHPPGKKIAPHVHNPVEREVAYTQETLFIRRGRMRVDLYDERQGYLASYVLTTGDVILLIKGGHGFEMLEDTEFVEVKQGPYVGEKDKTRFEGIEVHDVRLSR